MSGDGGLVVADANILIALLDPGHTHHDVVQRTLDRITPIRELDPGTGTLRERVALLHPLTAAEVLTGYGLDVRDRVLALVEELGIVVHAIPDPRSEALWLADFRGHVKMPDACVLALARETMTPVLTLDKRLRNAATEVGLKVADLVEA